VHEQDHRIRAIGALDGDPLFDATDTNVDALVQRTILRIWRARRMQGRVRVRCAEQREKKNRGQIYLATMTRRAPPVIVN
jgi:hypothetical protein